MKFNDICKFIIDDATIEEGRISKSEKFSAVTAGTSPQSIELDDVIKPGGGSRFYAIAQFKPDIQKKVLKKIAAEVSSTLEKTDVPYKEYIDLLSGIIKKVITSEGGSATNNVKVGYDVRVVGNTLLKKNVVMPAAMSAAGMASRAEKRMSADPTESYKANNSVLETSMYGQTIVRSLKQKYGLDREYALKLIGYIDELSEVDAVKTGETIISEIEDLISELEDETPRETARNMFKCLLNNNLLKIATEEDKLSDEIPVLDIDDEEESRRGRFSKRDVARELGVDISSDEYGRHSPEDTPSWDDMFRI